MWLGMARLSMRCGVRILTTAMMDDNEHFLASFLWRICRGVIRTSEQVLMVVCCAASKLRSHDERLLWSSLLMQLVNTRCLLRFNEGVTLLYCRSIMAMWLSHSQLSAL
jgi:hypothetical protein